MDPGRPGGRSGRRRSRWVRGGRLPRRRIPLRDHVDRAVRLLQHRAAGPVGLPRDRQRADPWRPVRRPDRSGGADRARRRLRLRHHPVLRPAALRLSAVRLLRLSHPRLFGLGSVPRRVPSLPHRDLRRPILLSLPGLRWPGGGAGPSSAAPTAVRIRGCRRPLRVTHAERQRSPAQPLSRPPIRERELEGVRRPEGVAVPPPPKAKAPPERRRTETEHRGPS